MNKRRVFSMVLVLVMVISVLGGCSKETAKTSSSKDKVIQLMFWDDLNTTQDTMSLHYKKYIDQFNALDNGYRIEVTSAALSNNEYDTKLNSAIAAKKTPDIFFVNPGPTMTKFVEKDIVLDLTDTLKKESEWKSTFQSGIFDGLTYDNK